MTRAAVTAPLSMDVNATDEKRPVPYALSVKQVNGWYYEARF